MIKQRRMIRRVEANTKSRHLKKIDLLRDFAAGVFYRQQLILTILPTWEEISPQ
jgi:hypothetical protein